MPKMAIKDGSMNVVLQYEYSILAGKSADHNAGILIDLDV